MTFGTSDHFAFPIPCSLYVFPRGNSFQVTWINAFSVKTKMIYL